MTSNNNTIIISDTPSPVKDHGLSKSVTNYRKRLRSSDSSRVLLDTPYESPLNHFRRNLRMTGVSVEDVIDVATVSGRPVRKRKMRSIEARQLFNPDESVVIVADQRMFSPLDGHSEGSSSDEETDVLEVPEERRIPDLPNSSGTNLPKVKTNKKGKSTPKRSKKLKKKGQQVKEATKGREANQKTPRNRRNLKNAKSPKSVATESLQSSKQVNDENHDGQIMGSKKNEITESSAADAEEIEVVWSSRPDADVTSAPIASLKRAKISPRQPIVVDVMPSLENARFYNLEGDSQSAIVSEQHRNGLYQAPTRNNDNIQGTQAQGRLREIVVDGSNVAMGHSRNKTFSEKGLQIVIDYFKSRGHTVKVFLPQSSRARGRQLIEKLHDEGTVIFTPSRKIAGRNITPYDDRFILDYATKCEGIVVSSDQYRDLWAEKPEWRNTIENRLLAPTFVGDYLMFPEDPLGRAGPKLEQFLRF